MAYYLSRYIGEYRLEATIDMNTGDFPRDENDNIEQNDVFISCRDGNKIFHYGRDVLEAYIPSIGRGHNIIKAIYRDYINPSNVSQATEEIDSDKTKITYKILDDNLFMSDMSKLNSKDIIYEVSENDDEVFFKFKAANLDKVAPLLKTKSGSPKSPFSPSRLPKSDYVLDNDKINAYKEITSQVDKSDLLIIGRITDAFLNTTVTKKIKPIDVKTDMKKKYMMRQKKEYIDSIGMWDEFLKYIDKEIKKYYTDKKEN